MNPTSNALLEHRLVQVENKAEKHDQDLYRGNGKPGITTRMQKVEDGNENLEGRMEKVENRHLAILMLLIVNLLAVIADLVKHSMK